MAKARWTLAATLCTAIAANAADPILDPCEGKPRCTSLGPLVAEIVGLTAAQDVAAGKRHGIRLDVRLKNVSSDPIVLAYVAESSTLVDTRGNRYLPGRARSRDVGASGIGVVDGRRADPQLVLRPGEAREASFQVYRYEPAAGPVGAPATYDVTIAELAALRSETPRTATRYALHFTGLETPPASPHGDTP